MTGNWIAKTNEFVSDEGMSLREIARILDADILSGIALVDHYLVTRIAATDLMSGVLAYSQPGTLLMTGLANIQVINTAEVAGLSGVVFMGGVRPPVPVIMKAEALELVTMVTVHAAYSACNLLFGWDRQNP